MHANGVVTIDTDSSPNKQTVSIDTTNGEFGRMLFPGHYPGMWTNRNAFAVIRKDGSVVTWGKFEWGGDSGLIAERCGQVPSVT